jgi:hypothetical protein
MAVPSAEPPLVVTLAFAGVQGGRFGGEDGVERRLHPVVDPAPVRDGTTGGGPVPVSTLHLSGVEFIAAYGVSMDGRSIMVEHASESGVVTTGQWRSRWLHVVGLAAMTGGIIVPSAIAVEDIVYPAIVEMMGTLPYTLYFLVAAVGALALVIGTAGLHVHERESYGRLGLVGAVITGVGFASIAVATTLMALTVDISTVWIFGTLGFIGTPLGVSILGIACWRSGNVPRVAAGLFVLGLPAFIGELLLYEPTIALTGVPLSSLLFVVPFGVPWIIVGHWLWSRPAETRTAEPTVA